jgi:HEAT repeat protein
MRTVFRVVAGILALVALVGLLAGCGGSKSKVDLQAQLTALKGKDKNAQMDALTAIATMHEEGAPAVPSIIDLLKSPDPLMRSLAAYTLGQIGAPAAKALPALKGLLEDADRNVVSSAVNAIREIDPKALDSKVVIPNVQ